MGQGMTLCAYCERPLICDGCGAEYVPPTRDHYESLSRPEVPVTCTGCGSVIVCHWCKTPYSGDGGGWKD